MNIAQELNQRGLRHCVTAPSLLRAYSADAFTLIQEPPMAVVLPESREDVSRLLRWAADADVKVVARGAGTSLSGGATPSARSVVMHFSRMNRIRSVDARSRMACVEPGVVNQWISREAARYGLFYAPDPSSQQASTIGGNIAENSGGPHCLKYGVTVNHVLEAEVVWADGRISRVGNRGGMPGDVDILGVLTGSEGTLGIITEAWVKLVPRPTAAATVQAVFDDVDSASQAVSDIIGAGIVPAALEMMDRLAVEAVERGTYHVGYPLDLGAVLLVEVDGTPERVQEDRAAVLDICRRHHVRTVKHAETVAERDLWWANRKTAFGAMGLIAPRYYVQDGVIPRSRLPEALQAIEQIARTYGIRIANVFHAGDGNLHPLLLYDDANVDEVARVIQAGHDILAVCVGMGGSISGEHGVGLEKRDDMRIQFTEAELGLQRAWKRALDPHDILNPGKIFPTT